MFPRLAPFLILPCLTLLTEPSVRSAPPQGRKTERTDCYGDRLPPGAIARMGSVLFYHGTASTCLAYSPDGRSLAVSGSGGGNFNSAGPLSENRNCIRLLDATTGKELRQLQGHRGTKSVRFSPDGKLLFSTGISDDIKIWDVATGKELRHFEGNDLTHDGKTLIVADPEKDTATIRFSETKTGKLLREITVHHKVERVVSAPDGKTFVGRVGKFIYIWDAATGKELHQLAGVEKWVDTWLAFSPNGETLGVCYNGKVVKLWDARTGKELHQWSKFPKFGHVTPAFSPDSKTLAVPGPDETIQLWNVKTSKETGRIKVEKAAHLGMAFAPDGKTLAWGTRGEIHLWDLAEKRERRPPGRLPEAIEVVAFSPDGKTLLTSGWWEGPIRSWEIATGKELRQLQRPESLVPPVFSPSADLFALVDYSDKKPRLFDLATGREIPLRGQPPKKSHLLAFSPDGRTLAVGAEVEIRLWDTTTGKEQRSLLREGTRDGIAFTEDGKTLLERATGEDGPHIKMWDVATGKLRGKVRSLRIPLCMAISPDGRCGAGVVLKTDQDGDLKDVRIRYGICKRVRAFLNCGPTFPLCVIWLFLQIAARWLACTKWGASSVYGKWPRGRNAGNSRATGKLSNLYPSPPMPRFSPRVLRTTRRWFGI